MTAVIAFAVLILVIRGIPALFNLLRRKLFLWRWKKRWRALYALSPPGDSSRAGE